MISASVDPFAKSGLDEALGFAIGARCVGPGKAMTQAQLKAGVTESMGAVTVPVIGEDGADRNAEAGVIGDSSMEEIDGCSCSEVGQNLGEGNAGMIVDGDVKVLPAGVMGTAPTTVGADFDIGETAQLLDVEVQQIAGSLVLVADDGRSRFQIAPAVEAKTPENAAHGSAASAGGLGNMQSCQALAAKLFHSLNDLWNRPAR